MKFLIVFAAVVACAYSGAVTPLAYNGLNFGYGYTAPFNYGYSNLGYSNLGYSNLGYSNLGYSNLGYSNLGYSHVAAPIAAPLAYSGHIAAPVAVATGFKSQYHAQDELGQASYGHSEPLQTHNAVQDVHGNKIGSYSYLAPDGQVKRTDYIADAAGYRVTSNALPVGPTALPIGPAQISDVPEVIAARAAHLAEYEAVKSRSKRGVVAIGQLPASTAPLAYSGIHAPLAYSGIHAPLAYSGIHAPLAYSGVHAPLAYSGVHAPLAYSGVHAPLAYSGVHTPLAYNAIAAPAVVAAPAVREATLTTIVNNPGHAVSYRVDK